MRYKFRIWHKLKKKMVSHHEIEYIDFRDGYICHRIYIGDGEATEDIITGSIEDYEIMQWTGLKDKNGVDIYEGDILKTTHRIYDREKPNINVVEFKDFGFRLVSVSDERATDAPLGLYAREIECIELLGNIYEQPSLLGRQGSDSTAILNEVEAE